MKILLISIFVFALFLIPSSATAAPLQRILVLIIASDEQPVYQELQNVWRSYMHLYPRQIEAYFIKGNPNLFNSYSIKGDTIWLKTEETFEPGILNKTLLAYEAFLPQLEKYDYILRTNLSSFYIFPRLLEFTKTLPKTDCYSAVPIPFGKPFGSGAGFLLSPDLVRLLVTNKSYFIDNRSSADDVVIGNFLYDQGKVITPAGRFDILTREKWLKKRHKIPKTSFHIRVKNPNPELRATDDIFIHKKLVHHFYGERLKKKS